MAKRCPSCGYQPIGPFTDNCPICAEPVRNVRSDPDRAGTFGFMPLWLRWFLAGAAAVVLCAAGCCGLGLWRMSGAIQDAGKMIEQAREKAEAERRARTVAVTAADLLKEFADDPDAADRKYQGKCLEIAGVVERRGKGADGVPFVILHGGDEKAQVKIECFFESAGPKEETRRERQTAPGQTVTVYGDYAGRVSHVQLRGCRLLP